LQGVLAQAKNDDEFFWEEKFHEANEKAQCTQGVFLVFLLSLKGVGNFILFYFSLVP
jgi:hypothetical protein